MPAAFSTSRDDQSPVVSTSLYTGPQPLMRDALDAARTLWRRTPEAQYPDGYVDSALTSRREDRVGTAVWRQNKRSYTRGVHKGERIDPSDYLWPSEFNLYSGLEQQAMGRRFVAAGIAEGQEPLLLRNDGKPGPRDSVLGATAPVPVIVDPDRAATLKRLAPTWS